MSLSVVRSFTDPDTYFSSIQSLRIDGFVTERGEFRAEWTRVELQRLRMHRFDENLAKVMRVTPSGTRALLLFATDPGQPAMLTNGIETSQGRIAMFGLVWPYYLRSSASTGWGTVSLTPEDLALAGETMLGRELTPPSFMRAIKPPMPTLSRLRKLHEAAGHLAKAAPDVVAKPEVARALEQALMEAMIFCVADGRAEPERTVQGQRARVMRRFEEILSASSDQPLYIAELCAAVGASYWMLRDCCRDYLGMAPKRYLWLRRMHLAQRALRHADPGSTTVTEVATGFGFWELGRFSVAYRSLFDETPSTTLRRTPDAPRRDKTSRPTSFHQPMRFSISA